MKIISLCFFFCLLVHSVWGQTQPTIVFKYGVVAGNQIEKVDEKDFGFKFLFEQELNDTIKCRFIHSSNGLPLFEVSYKLTEPKPDFFTLDMNRLKAGDKLHFFFDISGQKSSETFDVISTISSLQQPYTFTFYFLYNGDTLTTDKYKIYGGDSLTTGKFGVPARVASDFLSEKGRNYWKVNFSESVKLPKVLLVYLNDEVLHFDFNSSAIYHGVAVMRYNFKSKRLKKKWPPVYNSHIEIIDLDTGKIHGHSQNN